MDITCLVNEASPGKNWPGMEERRFVLKTCLDNFLDSFTITATSLKLWTFHQENSVTDYAEKSPFAVFGFRPLGAPKNGSKKLIEN
jgi:hypothetical protein